MTKDPIRPRTVFVVSPIGSPGTPDHRRYQLALDYIVKKALRAPDWRVIRADSEEAPDSIGTKVIERILECDLIIANLTDQNPNVFYELAVAHGYKRPVIHMMESGQKIPFDVSDQRAIFYDLSDPESVDQARERLAAAAQYLQENDGEARNPLSQYAAFKSISSATSTTDVGSAVADALQDMSASISRLAVRIDSLEIPDRRSGMSWRSLGTPEHGPGYWTSPERWKELTGERMTAAQLRQRLDEVSTILARVEADDVALGPEHRQTVESLTRERARLQDLLLVRKESASVQNARKSSRE